MWETLIIFCVWYGRSVGLIAHREETISWSPSKCVDLGYKWTVNEVSITEEGLSENGISEREDGRFTGVDERCCAFWRKAEIELDLDLVHEEDDVFIGLDLKLYNWVKGWEEELDKFFDDFLDSQIRISSTEEVEFELDESFGNNKETFSELKPDLVFRSGTFA